MEFVEKNTVISLSDMNLSSVQSAVSSDSAVAEVTTTSTGVTITSKKAGTCSITVKESDAKTATIAVTVASDGTITKTITAFGMNSVTGSVTVSGSATEGQVLTASYTGGAAGETVSYQWYADDSVISGATNLTYTLTSSEVGKTIKIIVSGTGDYTGSVSSTATAAVVHAWNTGSVTTAATCTATGVKTYTCSVCSATKTDTIPAAGHNYGAWSNGKRTCSICGIETIDYSSCVIGDFILKDGSVLSKDTTLTTEQKSNVAAVIFRAQSGDSPALGVGVHQGETQVWCTSAAGAYSNDITGLNGTISSGYTDGSTGFSILSSSCPDAVYNADWSPNPDTVYPAWYFCVNYATTYSLTNLSSGWYLPTVAELYTFICNKDTVNTSLAKTSGTVMDTESYWTCSTSSGEVQMAYIMQMSQTDPDMGQAKADKISTYRVCAVRAFK